MTESEWNSGFVACFGMRLGGDAMLEWDERGERVLDDTFLLLFNGAASDQRFTLPTATTPVAWDYVLGTADDVKEEGSERWPAGESLQLVARSVTVLKRIDAA